MPDYYSCQEERFKTIRKRNNENTKMTGMLGLFEKKFKESIIKIRFCT